MAFHPLAARPVGPVRLSPPARLPNTNDTNTLTRDAVSVLALRDAKLAESLTARYGRDGVPRQYLRLVPYANNIHGIAYAARRYVDKPVADLS